VKVAVEIGVNVTLMVQEAPPAGSVPTQLFVSAKPVVGAEEVVDELK